MIKYFETFYYTDFLLIILGIILYLLFTPSPNIKYLAKNLRFIYNLQVHISSLISLLCVWQVILCFILNKGIGMIILFVLFSMAGIRDFISDFKNLKQIDKSIDEYEKKEEYDDDDEQE